MALKVIENDNTITVEWQEHFSITLLNTPSNKKALLVFLRSLVDEEGKPLFTFQELSVLFESNNRQASSQHMEDFRNRGSDFLDFLTRKRKVDSNVVEAVSAELTADPLASIKELRQRVNDKLGQDDLSDANIKAALEQIPYTQVRDSINRQIEKGEAHYKEEYLLGEMMNSKSTTLGQKAGIQVPQPEGMKLSDPTSIRKLTTPDVAVEAISNPIRWVVFCMTLYYHGVQLSALSRWLGVHKSTILRWMLSLSLEIFLVVYGWVLGRVKASIVYVDEKWIKIKDKWYYWYIVLDYHTEIPVLGMLLDSRSEYACKWIGQKLKDIGKIPKVIVSDGLPGYRSMIEGAKHILCHFHHQQGVTRWLNKRFGKGTDISDKKKKMKKVLATKDRRTVKRRLEKLKQSPELGEWLSQTEGHLPQLLPAVGSTKLPRTTNAIERFIRAFNRFYKMRCGFFSVVSTKRELIFFMLMYLFVQQEDGKAPIERIIPEAARMPFYKLVNDPLGMVLGVRDVKKSVKMADFKLHEYLAA